jgi:transposase
MAMSGVILLTQLGAWSLSVVRESRPDEKAAALRAAGALNPHPQTVHDPLFTAHPFFDGRDLVQVKYEMLRRVQRAGGSVTQAAADFGFSRVSFYQTQAAFAEGGLPALIPRRRGPRGAHKLTEDVMVFLDEVRAETPELSSRDLAGRVQERFALSVHPRSIERAFERRLKKPPSPLR